MSPPPLVPPVTYSLSSSSPKTCLSVSSQMSSNSTVLNCTPQTCSQISQSPSVPHMYLTREHTENTVASSLQQQHITMSPSPLVPPVAYSLSSSSPQTCLSVSSQMSSNSTALNCTPQSCSQISQCPAVPHMYSLPLIREHTENTVASFLQQQHVTMSPPPFVSPVAYSLSSSSPQTCLSVSSQMFTQDTMLSSNSTAFNCAPHSCSHIGQSLSVYSLPLIGKHTENMAVSSLQNQHVTMSPPPLVPPVAYSLSSSSPQTCLSVSSQMFTHSTMLSPNSTALNCAPHSCSQLGKSPSVPHMNSLNSTKSLPLREHIENTVASFPQQWHVTMSLLVPPVAYSLSSSFSQTCLSTSSPVATSSIATLPLVTQGTTNSSALNCAPCSCSQLSQSPSLQQSSRSHYLTLVDTLLNASETEQVSDPDAMCLQQANLGTEDTTSVTRSASCTSESPLSSLNSNLLVRLLAAVTKENASIITTAILSNKNLVDAVTNAVTGIINKECSILCRHSTDNRSPFRKVFVLDMSSFSMEKFHRRTFY